MVHAYAEGPKFLNLHYRFPSQGGLESHLLMFNKVFEQHQVSNTLLTSQHSTWLVKNINLPPSHYGPTCRTYHHEGLNPSIFDIINTCKDLHPSTIICNWMDQLPNCIKAAKNHSAHTIYMHHTPKDSFTADEIMQLNQTNGIITVSPTLAMHLKKLQETGVITVKHLEHIAPFWDEDQFLGFKPTRSKKDFFINQLQLNIPDDSPVICSVANLYWYKNHKLLLHAIDQLIHKRQKKFHVILAGDGSRKNELITLTRELNLTDYVHFVGKIHEVPELLYHADFHVLPSSNEPFGLTHLEAATMKKPFVGATETGAAEFIQHGVTGFIFENNNAQDLADTLEKLLDNPALCKIMGENAYTFVHQNYSNEALFKKWMIFLKQMEAADASITQQITPQPENIDHITIAILAKDMAHVLPLYLSCIEQQTWPKNKTYLYIRTNNNKDNTIDLLKAWMNQVGSQYAGIYFDDTDTKERVEKYGIHQWNSERFRVLGKIRQDSVTWAHEHKSHYFVADCDNFIRPDTIEVLMNTNLPVIGPLLRRNDSNENYDCFEHGPSTFHVLPPSAPQYWRPDNPLHTILVKQEMRGLIKVPIIHCTYLIRHEYLDQVSYDDNTGRWEFAIFSDTLNKQGIPQYVDTREVYGYLTRAENGTELVNWLTELKSGPWLKKTLARITL